MLEQKMKWQRIEAYRVGNKKCSIYASSYMQNAAGVKVAYRIEKPGKNQAWKLTRNGKVIEVEVNLRGKVTLNACKVAALVDANAWYEASLNEDAQGEQDVTLKALKVAELAALDVHGEMVKYAFIVTGVGEAAKRMYEKQVAHNKQLAMACCDALAALTKARLDLCRAEKHDRENLSNDGRELVECCQEHYDKAEVAYQDGSKRANELRQLWCSTEDAGLDWQAEAQTAHKAWEVARQMWLEAKYSGDVVMPTGVDAYQGDIRLRPDTGAIGDVFGTEAEWQPHTFEQWQNKVRAEIKRAGKDYDTLPEPVNMSDAFDGGHTPVEAAHMMLQAIDQLPSDE